MVKRAAEIDEYKSYVGKALRVIVAGLYLQPNTFHLLKGDVEETSI